MEMWSTSNKKRFEGVRAYSEMAPLFTVPYVPYRMSSCHCSSKMCDNNAFVCNIMPRYLSDILCFGYYQLFEAHIPRAASKLRIAETHDLCRCASNYTNLCLTKKYLHSIVPLHAKLEKERERERDGRQREREGINSTLSGRDFLSPSLSPSLSLSLSLHKVGQNYA